MAMAVASKARKYAFYLEFILIPRKRRSAGVVGDVGMGPALAAPAAVGFDPEKEASFSHSIKDSMNR